MLFKKLVPALGWAAFILALCILPGSAIPELTFLDWLKPDKIVHLILFGELSYLLVKAFLSLQQYRLLNGRAALYAILFSGVYGILVELVQEFLVASRQGDVYDAAADTLGALIGIWFFKFRQRRRMKTKQA